jgi:hypothetical protein
MWSMCVEVANSRLLMKAEVWRNSSRPCYYYTPGYVIDAPGWSAVHNDQSIERPTACVKTSLALVKASTFGCWDWFPHFQ